MKDSNSIYTNTFIGIPLPDNISKKYLKLLEKLKTLGLEVELHENDISHITLYFLGNQSAKNIDKVKKLLVQSIYKNKTGNIQVLIENLSSFSKPENVVVYLEVAASEKLKLAYQSLASLLKDFHYENRSFIPHITISRKFTTQNHLYNKSKLSKETEKIKWEFTAKEICLFGRSKANSKMQILYKLMLAT